MGKQYKHLSPSDISFIQRQKMFFIASCAQHEVNLSPRGYDSLFIADDNTLYMIDYLGSGNRTARDINEGGEVTLMFNAFEGAPKILRCFCKGSTLLPGSDAFDKASVFFQEDMRTIRQIFRFDIYAVESSCGMGVPLMEYKQERDGVKKYALKMADENTFEQYVADHLVPPDLTKL